MAQFITIAEITAYTSLDGNIDNDSISPNIDQAQINEIKRILGDELYTKINDDLNNNTPLEGDYLALFEKYIVRLHSYYTAQYYLELTVPKVSQNGAHIVTPEKTEPLSMEWISAMAQKYSKLAVGLELKMVEYLDELNLPERPAPSTLKAKSNFNWIRVN